MAVLALAAATVAVGALGSYQEYKEGQYAKGADETAAASLRQQARYAEQEAGMKIAQQDYAAEHQIAAGTATMAASGIEETEGSPELMRYTSANQARINDIYTKYAANIQAAGFDTQASITQSLGEETARGAEAAATLDFASDVIGAARQPGVMSALSQLGSSSSTTAVGGSSPLGSSSTPTFNFSTSPGGSSGP